MLTLITANPTVSLLVFITVGMVAIAGAVLWHDRHRQ